MFVTRPTLYFIFCLLFSSLFICSCIVLICN